MDSARMTGQQALGSIWCATGEIGRKNYRDGRVWIL
jgi:hypothetical protein